MKATLIDPKDKQALDCSAFWHPENAALNGNKVLITSSPLMTRSTFKSVSATTAGTVELTAPNAAGSLMLADLIISAERLNGGEVTVEWSDGTTQSQIFHVYLTDAPVNVAIAFTGRVQGWTDAAVNVVTTGNAKNTVFLSYAKVNQGLPFGEWDALR